MFENRPQFDLLVDILEFMDAFLQALGDRQVGRLDENPAICLRGVFSPKQEVVNLPIDEVAVALEVLLVDIKPCPDPSTPTSWVVALLFDCTAAIMTSESLARYCRARAGLQLTAVRFSRFS